MFGERLADLDELVLRCRSEQAKQYIAEAAACYRAGAFRASIVATWVAVVFDFIHKLEELALTGDAEAVQRREAYERIRQEGQLQESLKFENEVLVVARDKFEFISPLEFEDLKRLKEDRNRCAHPSMISYNEAYLPSAELARYHLSNAVMHLLQHPPVQGRAAMDRIMRDINSLYFPTATHEALERLHISPLARSRTSLLRNFIIILLKTLLQTDMDENPFQRYAAALNAAREMDRVRVEEVFTQDLGKIVQSVTEDHYRNILRFLASVSDVWHYLPANIAHTVRQYIRDISIISNIPVFHFLLDFKHLRPQALQRLSSISSDELLLLLMHKPRIEFIERSLEIYSQARSFASANSIASQLLIPLASLITIEHFSSIVELAIHNGQISESIQFIAVLRQIQQQSHIVENDFQQLTLRLALEIVTIRNDVLPILTQANVEQLVISIAQNRQYGGQALASVLLEKAQESSLVTQEQVERLCEQYDLVM